MSNPDEDRRLKRNAYMRAYYAANKKQCQDTNRRSKEAHKHLWPIDKERFEATKKKHQVARVKNVEYNRRYSRNLNMQVKAEAVDLVKTRWAAWYEKPENKAQYLAVRKANYHPQKESQRKKQSNTLLKQRVLAMYGGCCACCGEDNFGFLTLDHKNNDGGKRRRAGEVKGLALYRRIELLGFPDDMQVLCWNCNIAKYVYGQCPHQIASEFLVRDPLFQSNTPCEAKI
jgi:hypothetical protein